MIRFPMPLRLPDFEVLRSPLSKFAFLAGLAILVFGLPYVFPVKPAVSVSYIVGYNNRAAVILLLAGASLFAILSSGKLAERDDKDSTLSIKSLLLAEAITLICCVLFNRGVPQGEAQYQLHRQQMLDAGRHLYTQFDYLYGPALLMPGLWISRLFHLQAIPAYFLSLSALTLAGVWMLWFTARSVSIPFRYRTLLFFALFAVEGIALTTQGTHYTPVRRFAAAFSACLVYRIWIRRGDAIHTALAAIAAVGFCLCVSPEQGVAITAGLTLWLALGLFTGRPGVSWAAIGLFGIGASLCFAVRSLPACSLSSHPLPQADLPFLWLPLP